MGRGTNTRKAGTSISREAHHTVLRGRMWTLRRGRLHRAERLRIQVSSTLEDVFDVPAHWSTRIRVAGASAHAWRILFSGEIFWKRLRDRMFGQSVQGCPSTRKRPPKATAYLLRTVDLTWLARAAIEPSEPIEPIEPIEPQI